MASFRALFHRDPVVTADAPGRVNLIGEHTDYNGGFVLPTPIPQRCHLHLTPRADSAVRAASRNAGGGIAEYRLGEERAGRGWLDFVQGVTHILRAEGHSIRGFEAFIDSEVPLGSGLSSSAALDVSLMRALRAAFDLRLDAVTIARLGQRVENQFVGAQVGIMDPMACSLGREGTALFLDSRSLKHELVSLPAEADLVVINSGLSHQHSAGDYNMRRTECERACTMLGVPQLRDLGEADLPSVKTLPEPLNRRARHVITENARVLAAVEALRAGALQRLGELFFASHVSQRDDYEVSIPEIDLLVELARADGAVYGARLTGGGFGGSIVILAHLGEGAAVAERMASAYAARTGRQATVLVPAAKLP